MIDTRMTNNRKALRWWTCNRCDNQYPEDRVVIQKGLVLCTGPNTLNCRDEYGYQHYVGQLEVPYEEVPKDPPTEPWDDI